MIRMKTKALAYSKFITVQSSSELKISLDQISFKRQDYYLIDDFKILDNSILAKIKGVRYTLITY